MDLVVLENPDIAQVEINMLEAGEMFRFADDGDSVYLVSDEVDSNNRAQVIRLTGKHVGVLTSFPNDKLVTPLKVVYPAKLGAMTSEEFGG